MEISGRIQNGVVVLDEFLELPEGTAVTVTIRSISRMPSFQFIVGFESCIRHSVASTDTVRQHFG